MAPKLSANARGRLIDWAKESGKQFTRDSHGDDLRKILSLLPFALRHLKQHDLPEFEQWLSAKHASTAPEQHWQALAWRLTELRRVIRDYGAAELPTAADQREGLLYAIGVLHRMRHSLAPPAPHE